MNRAEALALLDGMPRILCYDRRPRTEPPTSICLHVPVTPEWSGAAEAVATYLSKPRRDKAGIHFTVDNDSDVMCADPRYETVPHCYRPSSWSIGIEIAGTVQSAADWADDFSTAALARAARLCAALCLIFDIPPKLLSPLEVAGRARGIFDHQTATTACRFMGWPQDGHHDVGDEFPWDWFLTTVEAELSEEDDSMGITFPVGPVNQSGPRPGRYPKVIPDLKAHRLTAAEGAVWDWPYGVTNAFGLSILDIDDALPGITVEWPCRVAKAADAAGNPVIVVTDSGFADFAFPVKVTAPG